MAVIYRPDNVTLVTSGNDSNVDSGDFEMIKESEPTDVNYPKDLQLWDTLYIDKSK